MPELRLRKTRDAYDRAWFCTAHGEWADIVIDFMRPQLTDQDSWIDFPVGTLWTDRDSGWTYQRTVLGWTGGPYASR